MISCNTEGIVEQKKIEYSYIPNLDTLNILSNKFLVDNFNLISSEEYTHIDSVPDKILNQLNILTTDSFKAVGLDESLRMSKICPDNKLELPCRKLEYIGISDNYVIISYLQVCDGCHNYANNILVIQYDLNEIVELWVGNVPPYFINTISPSSHDFMKINLINSDTIFNYLKTQLNKKESLHILSQIVI